MAAMIDLLPILMLDHRLELVSLRKTSTDHLITFVIKDEKKVRILGKRVIPHITCFIDTDDLMYELWCSPRLRQIK